MLSALIDKYGYRRVLCITFVITFAFFCVGQIPTKSIILNSIMTDMTRTIIEFIMYASGTALIIFFIMDAIIYFYNNVPSVIEYKRGKERKRVEGIINNVLREIKRLTPYELALLRYVYDTERSAVYIPTNDATGLTLLNKGYLRLVVNRFFPRVHGKAGKMTTECYLCELQKNLRDLLRANYDAINWKNSPVPDYDKYQMNEKNLERW